MFHHYLSEGRVQSPWFCGGVFHSLRVSVGFHDAPTFVQVWNVSSDEVRRFAWRLKTSGSQMVSFTTSAPVSSPNKAICGDCTGVLASLETLPASKTNRGCRYRSSRKSQAAAVAIEVLAVITRRMYRIHVASLQDNTRDPEATRGEAQAESSLVAESWHHQPT